MCDTAEWLPVAPGRVADASLTERVLGVRQAYTALDQAVLFSSTFWTRNTGRGKSLTKL